MSRSCTKKRRYHQRYRGTVPLKNKVDETTIQAKFEQKRKNAPRNERDQRYPEIQKVKVDERLFRSCFIEFLTTISPGED